MQAISSYQGFTAWFDPLCSRLACLHLADDNALASRFELTPAQKGHRTSVEAQFSLAQIAEMPPASMYR